MSDPYRGFADPEASRPERSARPEGGFVRPVLWVLLLLSAVCNTVTSSIGGISVAVPLALGLATLACGAGLVVHHRRQRRA